MIDDNLRNWLAVLRRFRLGLPALKVLVGVVIKHPEVGPVLVEHVRQLLVGQSGEVVAREGLGVPSGTLVGLPPPAPRDDLSQPRLLEDVLHVLGEGLDLADGVVADVAEVALDVEGAGVGVLVEGGGEDEADPLGEGRFIPWGREKKVCESVSEKMVNDFAWFCFV